jgi:predicted PurR-regulated permease PerM
MRYKSFKEFNKNLSWNTKFYVLLACAFIFFIWMLQYTESSYALPAALALMLVLMVDYAIKYFVKHPRVWNTLRWIIFFLLILLVLIGAN